MASASRSRILLVEPNDRARGVLQTIACSVGHVESHACFETARTRLRAGFVDFLVTNIRLGAFNGLHLAYIHFAVEGTVPAIVYSDERDPGLAREVQRASAFYEIGSSLPVTLPSYFEGVLPPTDRRDPGGADRRQMSRGGRRRWDLHRLQQAH